MRKAPAARPARAWAGAKIIGIASAHATAFAGIHQRGVVLLVAALVALVWANYPRAASYEHLWDSPWPSRSARGAPSGRFTSGSTTG